MKGDAFPLDRPARIAVFASGRGSNMTALIDRFGPTDPLGRVVLAVSDRPDARALSGAEERGVEAVHLPWPDRQTFEAGALTLLSERQIDLLCLAGFMRLLSADFISATGGRILNVHPSLLPEFPGLHPQRRALAAGAAKSGCTVHFVDSGMDTGRPVLQRSVPILPGDDEAALAARILEQEHEAYPEAVAMVLSGEVAVPAAEPTPLVGPAGQVEDEQ